MGTGVVRHKLYTKYAFKDLSPIGTIGMPGINEILIDG